MILRMNSNLLIIISLVASGVAIISSIYAAVAAGRIKLWRSLLGNQDEQPQNLEQIVTSIASKLKALEGGEETANQNLARLEEVLSHATQATGLVRYNSLADEGGNLSFSLALLDAHNSGVVITSLHGRQQNRIYAKPVVGGSSEVQLSEEEQSAVFAAIKTPVAKPAKTVKSKTKQTTKKIN